MGQKIQSATSGLVATFIIALIIISFLFTGYDGFSNPRGALAKVNGDPIRPEEVQNEFQRISYFYKQVMNQGGNLSADQQLEIQNQALESVINRKLNEILAQNLELVPGKIEIVENIKSQTVFQENGTFGPGKYRDFLGQYGINPADYEKHVSNEISREKVKNLMQEVALSDTYLKEIEKIKNRKILFSAVKVPRTELLKSIPVSNPEIETFLAAPESAGKLEAHFRSQKMELDKPMELKARHILLKPNDKVTVEQLTAKASEIRKNLTTANFTQKAKEFTEEPGGKERGGDLGWFTQGRMVPEFETAALALKKGEISAPVTTQFGVHLIYLEDKREEKLATLDEHKREMARQLVQREKSKELDALVASVTQELNAAFEQGNTAKVKEVTKKYGLVLEEKQQVSELGDTPTSFAVKPETLGEIFNTYAGKPMTKVIDNFSDKTVFHVESIMVTEAPTPASPTTKAPVQGPEMERSKLVGQLAQDMNNYLKNKISVKRYQ